MNEGSKCHAQTAPISTQGRSHQIWSGQVGSARPRMLYPRRVWGHVPPEKKKIEILIGAMRLLLRPILGLIEDQTT